MMFINVRFQGVSIITMNKINTIEINIIFILVVQGYNLGSVLIAIGTPSSKEEQYGWFFFMKCNGVSFSA